MGRKVCTIVLGVVFFFAVIGVDSVLASDLPATAKPLAPDEVQKLAAMEDSSGDLLDMRGTSDDSREWRIVAVIGAVVGGIALLFTGASASSGA